MEACYHSEADSPQDEECYNWSSPYLTASDSTCFLLRTPLPLFRKLSSPPWVSLYDPLMLPNLPLTGHTKHVCFLQTERDLR